MKKSTVPSCSRYTRVTRALELTRSSLATVVILLLTLSSHAQTNYTWNGGTSTDFATSTNWTPSGVPGSSDNITIVSTANDPVLDGNRTVNDLTMTSGILKLGSYAITVNGTADLNAGEVENGTFVMTTGTVDFDGTTMDCEVSIDASISGINNTIFEHAVTLESSGCFNSGGNVFMDEFAFTTTCAGYTNFSLSTPDTFLAPVTFTLEAAGDIRAVNNATGCLFDDDVTLYNHSGSSSHGIVFGSAGSPTIAINGDVTMNVTSGSGYISFNTGSTAHSGQLLIGGEGYNAGTLTLKGYEQASAVDVNLSAMTGTSELVLGPSLTLEGNLHAPTTQDTDVETGCHFKGEVDIPQYAKLGASIYDKKTILETSNGVATGGNMFKDSVEITSTYAGYVNFNYNTPDTFLAPVTFNLEAAGYLRLVNNAVGCLFDDDITINNHSGNTARGLTIGSTGSPTVTINGTVTLNTDATSGYVEFNTAATTHNGLLVIGSEGFNSGKLTLKNYEQTENGTINLSGMDSDADLDVLSGTDITARFIYGGGGTATLTDAVFQGDVTIESSSLPVTDCTFHGNTYLEKTGGVNNLNDGNAFYGPVTIENSSSGNYLYWGNAVADTFTTDLTLINHSTQPVWIGYSSETEIGGDLTLDGDSASVIRIGGSVSGRKVLFNGGSDQYLSILDEDLEVQAYRLEVNKSGGRIKVNNDVTLLNEFTLSNGVVECWNSAVITLNDGVEPAATDASYIEGRVQKIGNDAFDFPVGLSGKYRPISISAPNSATDAFTAAYHGNNSDPINSHDNKDGTLDYLSTNEYWILTRDVGTSTPVVTLAWDTLTSCAMDTSLAARSIAGWDGANWNDLGNGSTSGGAYNGTITTSSGVTDFEMFILESDSSITCSECQIGDYLGEEDTILTNVYINTEPIWYSFLGRGGEIIKVELPDSVPVASIDSITIYRDCYEGYTWIQKTDSVANAITIDTLFDVGVMYYMKVHADTSGYFDLSMRAGGAICNGVAPTVSAASYSPTVPLYGLQEIVIDVDACYSNYNPFDYRRVEIQGVFIPDEAGGDPVVVDAFFMQPFTHQNCPDVTLSPDPDYYEDNTNGEFRIRFTPHLEGSWLFYLMAEDEDPGTGISPVYGFEVDPNEEAKGFIRLNETSGYLQYENTNEPYVPTGTNLPWLWEYHSSKSMCGYDAYLDTLANHGIDHFRIWFNHYWSFDLESADPSGKDQYGDTNAARWALPNYEVTNYGFFQTRAYSLDHIFNASAARGITIKPCLNLSGNFKDKSSGSCPNLSWTEENFSLCNPYYQGGNGAIINTDNNLANTKDELMQMFDISHPVYRLMQNKHRYIVARWGYATHLQAWEIFNENYLIKHMEDCNHNANTALQSRVLSWNLEITSDISSWDPYDHLITTSNVDPDASGLVHGGNFYQQLFANDLIDFSEIHAYNHGNPDQSNLGSTAPHQEKLFDGIWRFSKHPSKIKKPTIVNEVGSHSWCDVLRKWDPYGFDNHHNIWIGFCGGGMGSSMPWWSEQYLNDRPGDDSCLEHDIPGTLWHQFDGISRFNNLVAPYLTEPVDIYQTRTQPLTGNEPFAEVGDGSWLIELNPSYRWTLAQNSKIIFGHVQDIGHDWKELVLNNEDYLLDMDPADKPDMANTGTTVTIDNVEPVTTYHVRWYNTETGIPSSNSIATSNGSAELTLAFPYDEGDYTYGDAGFIVLPCGETNNDVTYTEGQHSVGNQSINGSMVIEDGVEVTITGTVAFPPGEGIVVKPGGKLIVDGGTLTSSCDYMWQGIQVWGNRYHNQSWPNPTHQGAVELKNDAVIEQARVGVDVINLSDIANSGGGVVRAADATFLNCRKAVAYGPFTKHNNISSFIRVNFLTDAPLNDLTYGGIGTPEFVSIWDCYGISFTDCTFEFEKDNPNFTTTITKDRWPNAISGHHAGYKLLKSTTGNQFINLQHGFIGYDNFNVLNKIYSEGSTFTNVWRGADLTCYRGMDFFDNDFSMAIGELEELGGVGQSFGIRGTDNSHYKIRKNIFTSEEAHEGLDFGVVIRGTTGTNAASGGLINNDNDFNGLFFAFQHEATSEYLKVSCNSFDGNTNDWVLNPLTPGLFPDQGTMCPDPQQTNGTRAGNEFTNGSTHNIQEGLLQDRPTYYAAGGINSNTVPVSLQSDFYVDVHNCDMTLEDPTCDVTGKPPFEWEVWRYARMVDLSGKRDEQDSLVAHIDSSETQLMLDTIYNLNTNDTVLADVLLAHTPLSDTVLVAYLNRDTVVTPGNFQRTMLQNVPASKPVWELLKASFTGYKDDWQSVADTLTVAQGNNPGVVTYTSLWREIRYHSAEMHHAADEYVSHYVENDSLEYVKPYMDTVGLYPLRLALLGTEIGQGNWDEADSSLAKLPLVTNNDTAIYDLYDIFIDLGRDTLTLLEMNATDSTRVQQIAADTTLDAANIARGMLEVMLDTIYILHPEHYTEPSGKWGTEEEEEQEERMADTPTEAEYFKAYPNPFTNSTTIAYDLGKECELGCVLRLYDLHGRVLLEEMLSLQDGKGQFEVDMSRYTDGIYYCSLYGNKQLLQTEKLILMR